jgi:hypothetical protein
LAAIVAGRHLLLFRAGRLYPIVGRVYMWQLVQLVAEHEPQEELPPIGADAPSLLLEKEEKEENIRLTS